MFDEKKAAAKIAAPRHVFALVSLAAILGPEQSLVRLRAHYVRTEAVCLTRFCSCPRLYKNARRKQHTEMSWRFSTATVYQTLYMPHVSCYLMTNDVIKLKRFPNSSEEMLFFQPKYISCLRNFLLSIGGC